MRARLWSWWRRMGDAPIGHLAVWQVFTWWERRRPGYNAWLLALGVPSLALWALVQRVTGGAWPAAFALSRWWWGLLLANVCYCAGWGLEFIGRGGPHPREITDPELRRFLMEAGLWLSALVAVSPPILALWGALRGAVGPP